MRLRATRGFLAAALIGCTAMGACSLNTQPIPPGEQPDGGKDFGGGTGLISDASTAPGDGGGTTGNPGIGDAATDGSTEPDDAGDASLDADTDAHDE